MIAFIQYPLADLRSLLKESSGKLPSPLWTLLTPNKDFLKYTGQVRTRTRGGLVSDGWLSENELCSTRNAIKFPPPKSRTSKLLSRHFNHDGNVQSKYELIFKISCEGNRVDHTLDTLLGEEIKIKTERRSYSKLRLYAARPVLRTHYLFSTTQSAFNAANVRDFWVASATPLVFLYASIHENVQVNDRARKLASPYLDNSTVFFWSHVYRNETYRVLLFNHDAATLSVDRARTLRMAFMRLHCESVCLTKVLQTLAKLNGTATPVIDSAKAQAYLSKSLTVISRKHKELCIDIPKDIDLVKASFIQMNPGLEESIQMTMEQLNFRPQVATKVMRALDDMVNTLNFNFTMEQINISGEGNIYNKGRITTLNQTFNKVDNSDLSVDLKKHLGDLKVQIESMIKDNALDEDDSEAVASDYSALAKEATSSKPRKDRIKNILDGIEKFAEKSEKYLKPIKTIVGLILPFF